MVAPIWLCPGQGAQRVGMGRDLAERFPEARGTFEAIDDALGTSLSHVMWEGPEEELVQTHNAQPAILAHTAAVLSVLRAHRVAPPKAAVGHSLGEYSALVAAGALEATAAARLVRRRGELMLEAGRRRPGTMAAILGLAAGEVEAACREASRDGEVAVPANLNADDQTVVSGDPPAVERAGQGCKARGAKRVVPLKVSGAFHSPLMAPAQEPLGRALAEVPFRDPVFPVVANATAEAVTTAARARTLLVEQLTAPVRWVGCVRAAAELGGAGAPWVEVGPGNVLSGLVRRVVPEATATTLGTADEVTRYLEAA